MATAEVLLPSSPPTRQYSIYDIPSSSPLPTMSEILRNRKQAIQSGSRAAPIPPNASASFMSAPSLLKRPRDSSNDIDKTRSSYFSTGGEGNSDLDLQLAVKKASKPRKPAASRKKTIDSGAKEKKPRKPRVKKTVEGTLIDNPPQDGADTEVVAKKPGKPRATKAVAETEGDDTTKTPTRKPRSKKSGKEGLDGDGGITGKLARKSRAKKPEFESQKTLPTGKITKALAKPKGDKVVGVLKETTGGSAPADSLDPFADSVDLGLVEATKRRKIWTPPTTKSISTLASLNASNDVLASDGAVESGKKGFVDLFGNYAFTKVPPPAPEKMTAKSQGTRKRKLIELVKTNASMTAAPTPKAKTKASRKKAKTLTDQATSAYAQVEEEPALTAPLLQYFSYQTVERASGDEFKVLSKPRSKSPIKTAAITKGGSAEAPILLSPKSALKQVGNQDFVFGTSSQLARENSPTLLRDLHEAMQASNEIDDDPFADSGFDSLSPPNQAKRNLWSAASRDAAGQLLDVEMIDLINSPDAARRAQSPIAAPAMPLPDEDDVWHEIGDTPSCSNPLANLTLGLGSLEASTRAQISSPSSRVLPPPSPGISPAKPKKSKASQILPKPDYNGYTTSELTKEVASYRFKPIKSRDQMIALLEKCWEGKHRITLGVLDTNLKINKPGAPATSETAPLKRPRGRPRKDASTVSSPKPKTKRSQPNVTDTVAFLEMDSDTSLSQTRTPKKTQKRWVKKTVEEISDSDSPSIPLPRRRQATGINTTSLLLDITASADVETSPELSPAAFQKHLFAHITRAVTSAPRSTGPQDPNFHEKILLYDPIILEDLAVWLNTGALERAGWDGEVDPKEVKKWCESKSVCCLWKENLRGGSRTHY